MVISMWLASQWNIDVLSTMFTRISLFAVAIPYSLFSLRHIPPIWAKRRPYVTNAHRTNKQYGDTKRTGWRRGRSKISRVDFTCPPYLFASKVPITCIANYQWFNTANTTQGKSRDCSELPDLHPKLHSRLIAIKAIIGLSQRSYRSGYCKSFA